jgi:hypothetical protein
VTLFFDWFFVCCTLACNISAVMWMRATHRRCDALQAQLNAHQKALVLFHLYAEALEREPPLPDTEAHPNGHH